MIVLTVDQRGSTRSPDRVPEVLEHLADAAGGRRGLVVAFERTVGDEVQGVLDDAGLATDLVLDLLRDGGWSVGVGVGPVEEPLPAVSREARGPAFVRAREAVERAKTRSAGTNVAVDGPDADRAAEVEALLRLLGAVRARRSTAGWEVVDTLASLPDGVRAGRQRQAAAVLGITEQAVSQRVRAALWQEEEAARPVAARLLAELDDQRVQDG
ncbi:SatD family protein [Antribacter sp. KLBMP9083]|uniref:SatD family protein n=1 Tax=Antribacter soli TaxID=2910976 RepID=A0AA41QCR1_9MICO|nr:SatD family protein [Antribacter soli]MCF4120742.1 SatD family protein [Antribacter soli]